MSSLVLLCTKSCVSVQKLAIIYLNGVGSLSQSITWFDKIDQLSACGEVEERLPMEDVGDLDHQVKKELLEKVYIQLHILEKTCKRKMACVGRFKH